MLRLSTFIVSKKSLLMKTITVYVISSVVLFLIAAAPSPKGAKAFDGFSSLRTHRKAQGADVSWSFSSSAIGFTVQRTNDDPTDPFSVWIDVAKVSYNSSRTYRADDSNPFPGYVNYRVIALMSDQSTVTSPVSTVHIAAH